MSGIAAVVLLATLAVAPGAVGATAVGPPLPDRLQLVLAVPDGVEPSPALIAALQHEALLATGWLEAQTGRTFRGSLAQAVVVSIRLPDAPLRGAPAVATEQIERAVGRRQIDPTTMPVIATTLGLVDAPDTCGMGGPLGVVVFLGNCWTPPSSATRDFGRGVNRTIAHELVHALGGVPACAPNHEDGHVTDDPADLMSAVAYLGSGTVTFDAAGDDYFAPGDQDTAGRPRPGVCRSILDSPLWQR